MMPKPGFKLYLLWRVVKVILLFLTSPIWIPLIFLIASAFSIGKSMYEWYETVDQDWDSK